jgi:uncharacterized protein
MRLLLFSDLHCDRDAARRLVARADDADVLVGAGDFGSMRRNTQDCLEILCTVEQPAVLVPGNNESLAELIQAAAIWPSARVLHGSGCVIDGVPFFGLGGGVPVTPFGAWSWDFSEAEAEVLLAACPTASVLVSHSPPKGALDRRSSGQQSGSVAVRSAIEEKHPRLVACGHIHACAGQWDQIGPSRIVNAGPEGVLWDLARGEPIA